jgi:hypothetical protein
MDNHTISISVKNIRLLVLESFFIDHFSLHRSPVYPILISFNFHFGETFDAKTSLFLRDSCVCVASETSQEVSQPIAKIVFQEYPTYSIAFFDIVGGNPENFTRVDKLARCVIQLLKKLDYEILSIDPQELMTPSIPQLEGIDASPRDMKILKLYLVEKKTAGEIGIEFELNSSTINNIISRYRSIYGVERIPKRHWESVRKSKEKVKKSEKL